MENATNIPDAFAALAPLNLVNRRAKRYHGDNLAMSLDDFLPVDQGLIRSIYDFLGKLFAALEAPVEASQKSIDLLFQPDRIEEIVDQARNLGEATNREKPSPLLGKTIHDIRGGGLTPLIGQMQFAMMDADISAYRNSLYYLTRDHLKIMRNALHGLDDAVRNRDLEIRIHSTDLMVEKWSGALFNSPRGRVGISVSCLESVPITECCVEFGALDRVLYNLLNNACRHTAGDKIEMVLFPVPDRAGENLRIVLSNSLLPEDEQHLDNIDMATLFDAGVSTTGSGYGLSVAADFVAQAFGLPSVADAPRGGYLGAKVMRGQFVIWLHWPIVAGY